MATGATPTVNTDNNVNTRQTIYLDRLKHGVDYVGRLFKNVRPNVVEKVNL
jgi:hypothetical protein